MTVDGLAYPVALFAEQDAPQLPAGPDELREVVAQQVGAALRAPAVPIHSPGRFSPRGG